MSESDSHYFINAEPKMRGIRLDKALSEYLSEYSRSAIQSWIKQGLVLVDGSPATQKTKLSGTEKLTVQIPESEPADWPAQEMPLDILEEDEHILVLNKPTNLVVHPGAGNSDQTLLNGLLFHCQELANLPRAGIVHRLDKNTTGLMVVAKSELARQDLIEQLQSREMHRQYLAISNGIMISGETIDQPIARHRHDRLRMAVVPSGKPAITELRIVKKFRQHCLISARLKTGRTHQIRVHLSWKGYPIVGDSLYGNRYRPPPSASIELVDTLKNFNRQALHAEVLSLVHPLTREIKRWQCDPPEDMQHLLALLQQDNELDQR